MSATLICTEADAMRGAAIGAAEKPQTGAYRESMAKDCAGAIGTIERERRRATVGVARIRTCDGVKSWRCKIQRSIYPSIFDHSFTDSREKRQ